MENWKQIKGYEGHYMVSDCARIKSIKGGKSHVMSQTVNRRGYYKINMWLNGQRTFEVHRIVALHFMPNPENKGDVNHIDGNKLNNQLDNLEWATRSENQKHAFANGLNFPQHGTLSPKAKLRDYDAKTIKHLSLCGISYRTLAKEFNVHHSIVNGICNGTRWKHLNL